MIESKRARSRAIRIAGMTIAMILVIGLFQNFTSIPLSKLKPQPAGPQRMIASNDQPVDIREYAPRRPASLDEPQVIIAVPQSGTDMNSIGQDWATRQAHLITGGAEQRFLDDLNKRMTRMVRFEPVDGEPWPDEATDEGDGSGPKPRKPASVDDSSDDANSGTLHGMRPKSMRFTALNRVELALANRTLVSCSFQGDSMRLDLSRPINERMDVNLHHETAGAKSSLNLNYNW